MDFLQCSSCRSRFIVEDAQSGDSWTCKHCGNGLELVVSGLSGRRRRIEAALGAETLEFTDPDCDAPEVPP
jgi:PHP family Zn ribbon phosphoesterase